MYVASPSMTVLTPGVGAGVGQNLISTLLARMEQLLQQGGCAMGVKGLVKVNVSEMTVVSAASSMEINLVSVVATVADCTYPDTESWMAVSQNSRKLESVIPPYR
jgi:hypothetical protein